MAADGSGRAPLRGDPGAPAGAESGGCVEADRRQPGQAWGAESWPALPGAAAVRVLGADPVASPSGSGRCFGPMVVFAAATGLRPSELFALEQGDVDRAAGVVQVRRAYANGRVKHTKTRLSRRAVPLQAIALEALDQLRPRDDSPLLFPNTRGGHLDFRNFNRRHWKPVQKSSRDRAAARPLRPAPHLRHLRAPRRRPGVRALAVHGHEHRDDRPPLRPPRQSTATSTPSRSSTRSRSNGPWTLGGRRPAGPQSRTATRFPGLPGGVRGGWWTLGGRRGQKPSRPALSEGAD